jgi:hypothetical protein
MKRRGWGVYLVNDGACVDLGEIRLGREFGVDDETRECGFVGQD